MKEKVDVIGEYQGRSTLKIDVQVIPFSKR